MKCFSSDPIEEICEFPEEEWECEDFSAIDTHIQPARINHQEEEREREEQPSTEELLSKEVCCRSSEAESQYFASESEGSSDFNSNDWEDENNQGKSSNHMRHRKDLIHHPDNQGRNSSHLLLRQSHNISLQIPRDQAVSIAMIRKIENYQGRNSKHMRHWKDMIHHLDNQGRNSNHLRLRHHKNPLQILRDQEISIAKIGINANHLMWNIDRRRQSYNNQLQGQKQDKNLYMEIHQLATLGFLLVHVDTTKIVMRRKHPEKEGSLEWSNKELLRWYSHQYLRQHQQKLRLLHQPQLGQPVLIPNKEPYLSVDHSIKLQQSLQLQHPGMWGQSIQPILITTWVLVLLLSWKV